MFLLIMQLGYAFSQDDTFSIQYHFEAYNNSHYQEKVFLHTDKTVYTTGEVLWFKAYITDAVSNTFSSLSKICYVEIINNDKKSLLQGKISIDSGRGNGSFLLPSSIRSGNYLIRAYTNWMKNFDPQFYFEQTVSIINPNKKPEFKKANDTDSNYVSLFPEGGNLVYGLNNNIAFKITDKYGKGLHANGFIVSGKDSIISFETAKFGMGTFSFNPVKGNTYHAVIKINNTTLSKELPEIYNNGWTLHVKDEGNILSVNVACNVETEHSVFVFIQTKNVIKKAVTLSLNNGNANISFNKSEFGEGISQITVFNEKKQPVCERLYFKKPENVLQIKPENILKEYQTRNRVNLGVATNRTNGLIVNADMSVAVYLVDSLQPEQRTNILNYLWLTSDIKGVIESPGYYFEISDTAVDKVSDNLMLTQGWRRFKWDDVLKNTTPSFAFLPEDEGHIITGKLTPKIAGLHDTGTNVYLSVPSKNFRFSNSTSSPSGLIRFNVEKFYGSREIIAQTNTTDSNFRVFIDNPFSDQYDESAIQPLHLTTGLANKILLRSTGAQSRNIYQPEKEDNFSLPATFDTTAFYGNPFKTYYLDNYTRFPTMEEVMREYVKEVHVKKRDKSFHYEVFNEPDISYFNNDPLTLIDGVPVFDVTKIIDIDPLKIKRIDITATNFFRGNQQYNGIVSYATYDGDLTGYTLDPNSLVVEYEGLQYEREFYSPQYITLQQQQSRLPDYRNVLYWAPKVQTKNGKKDISFFTSDIPGKYIGVIQGISDEGIVGFATFNFTVSPSYNK
jgi:hypothetical protein